MFMRCKSRELQVQCVFHEEVCYQQHNNKRLQSGRKVSVCALKRIKTPKINMAPPSGLGLNGGCKNKKRNSGVKQIE